MTVGNLGGVNDEDIILLSGGVWSMVFDGADVGEEALVAAGSLVPPGMKVPDGTLVMGSPARVVRLLSAQEREEQRERARHYAELAGRYARGEAP